MVPKATLTFRAKGLMMSSLNIHTLSLRTLLKILGILDWIVLAIGIVGICTAIYLLTLRLP